MNEITAIRKFIKSRLGAVPAVAGLGIYKEAAKQSASLPYIVIRHNLDRSRGDRCVVGGERIFTRQSFDIVVCYDGASTPATLADGIDIGLKFDIDVLPLTSQGLSVMGCKRLEIIDGMSQQQDDAKRYNEIGGLYELTVQPVPVP